MANQYGLNIPEAMERRLGRCRASVRTAIHTGLRDIAVAEGRSRRRPSSSHGPKHPPLRFYVYEGYRVSYRLDRETRDVVVLEVDSADS